MKGPGAAKRPRLTSISASQLASISTYLLKTLLPTNSIRCTVLLLSSNPTMSPLPKRRKIEVPCQVDGDTVTGNEVHGESPSDIDLELQGSRA
jgi:hypothetical protein